MRKPASRDNPAVRELKITRVRNIDRVKYPTLKDVRRPIRILPYQIINRSFGLAVLSPYRADASVYTLEIFIIRVGAGFDKCFNEVNIFSQYGF